MSGSAAATQARGPILQTPGCSWVKLVPILQFPRRYGPDLDTELWEKNPEIHNSRSNFPNPEEYILVVAHVSCFSRRYICKAHGSSIYSPRLRCHQFMQVLEEFFLLNPKEGLIMSRTQCFCFFHGQINLFLLPSVVFHPDLILFRRNL